jgi:hypothetical protein
VFEVVETLQASPDVPLNVWFEPWAEGLTFPAGTVVELKATAPAEGPLEIDRQERAVAVYGWPSCTLQVVIRGEVARDFSIPVPELPPGMDMKGFVAFMFGPPPLAGAPVHVPPPKRRWWRFWETWGHFE